MRNWTLIEKLLVIFVLGGFFAMTLGVALAPAAECLSSSSEVFRAHPHASHAAYEASGGKHCWFAGYPRTHSRAARAAASKERKHPYVFAGAAPVDPSDYEGPADFNGRFFAYMGASGWSWTRGTPR